MTETKPKPVPLAMLICDNMIDDRISNKKSLIGVFNHIASPKIPFEHHSLNVFVTLTDGIGEYKGVLRCVKLDTDQEIIRLNGPILFPKKLAQVEYNFELKNVRFPSVGEYVFEFLCDDQPVISRKLTITQMKLPPRRPPASSSDRGGPEKPEEK